MRREQEKEKSSEMFDDSSYIFSSQNDVKIDLDKDEDPTPMFMGQ